MRYYSTVMTMVNTASVLRSTHVLADDLLALRVQSHIGSDSDI